MPKPHDAARRAVMLGAAATAAVASMRRVAWSDAAPSSLQLAELGAVEAVGRMQRGELTAERYAQALLERCEAGSALNAFIMLDPARVLEDARARDRERHSGAKLGPLFGLPIPVKDSVNTAGYATSAGTPALKEFRPRDNAPVVQALISAGALVLGKTNLHELSYGWTSNNLAFGAVHNPYDTARIPGGSSGGTAVTIAARMAPLGIAEDTEGSIRVPAAFCGIAGFRPTTGRYPKHACVPISPLFDQVGPHARNTLDLALFDSVFTRDATPLRALPLRGVRLGIVRDYFYVGLDSEVERITNLALSRLELAGAELVESELPGLAELIDHATVQVQDHDVRVALPRYLEEFGAHVTFDQLVERASPDIQAIFRDEVLPGGPHFVTEQAYAAARDRYLPQLRRLYRNYFARTGVAALVLPVTRVAAPPIGMETTLDIANRPVAFDQAVARNIAPGSSAGIPSLVLPAGLTASGLPVGLEFDGPAGKDRALLALGLSLEQALGPIPAPRARPA